MACMPSGSRATEPSSSRLRLELPRERTAGSAYSPIQIDPLVSLWPASESAEAESDKIAFVPQRVESPSRNFVFLNIVVTAALNIECI
jgi:hypothetical protein